MGVDFLRQKAKSFIKLWDRSRLELAQRTLFTRDPNAVATRLIASIDEGELRVGQRLIVRTDGTRLVALADVSACAEFLNPPADIVQRIRATGGYAQGEVIDVQPAIRLAEITIR